MNKRRIIIGLAAVWAVGVGAELVGIRFNATASMPRGIWFVGKPPERLARGQVVAVCPPDQEPFRTARARGYVGAGFCPGGSEPLLKTVAAVSGDKVEVARIGELSINDRPVPGSAPLVLDTQGRQLVGVEPGRYPVPDNSVWLVNAGRPGSWDSRYFGPLPVSTIVGLAHPVLTERR